MPGTSQFLYKCFDFCLGEHQYELMDYVAAKFYEETGVFKLLVSCVLNI